MITAVGSLAIRSARNRFSDGFAAWDESVARTDRQGAKAARRKIQAEAAALLPSPVANLPGWYVFVDLSRGAGVPGIHYIGIAKTERRSIGRRIIDRFKDDSCLDVALDDLPEARQRQIVERRLLTALPDTGSNYVDKHMSVANLFRKSTHILMIGTRDTVSMIEEVERQLIGSAVAAGAPLTNLRHRSFRGCHSEPGGARAHAILDHLRLMEMPQLAIDQWRSRLEMGRR